MDLKLCAAIATGLLISFLPASAQAQCAAGQQHLPLSGLCSGDASGKLGWPDKFFYDGLQNYGCQAEPAEVAFPGDRVLLYWASKCQGEPARLEVSAGARTADLSIVSGGLSPSGPPMQVGLIIGVDDNEPAANLLGFTRAVMKADGTGGTAIAACRAYQARAYAKDAWVVDDGETRKKQPKDAYPEIYCGRYGYTGDSRAFWRVFGGHSWYFDMGQDGYADFDPSTMMLVPRTVAAPQKATNNAQAATPAGPANIAGDPKISEQFYGQARQYNVYSGGDRSRVRYCVAERNFGGSILRIGYDGGQWQLAVPYAVKPGFYGGFNVDGQTSGISGTAANGWTFAWLSLPHLDALRQGNLLILDIGRASLDFTLDGSSAAILKVQECVQQLQ